MGDDVSAKNMTNLILSEQAKNNKGYQLVGGTYHLTLKSIVLRYPYVARKVEATGTPYYYNPKTKAVKWKIAQVQVTDRNRGFATPGYCDGSRTYFLVAADSKRLAVIQKESGQSYTFPMDKIYKISEV